MIALKTPTPIESRIRRLKESLADLIDRADTRTDAEQEALRGRILDEYFEIARQLLGQDTAGPGQEKDIMLKMLEFETQAVSEPTKSKFYNPPAEKISVESAVFRRSNAPLVGREVRWLGDKIVTVDVLELVDPSAG